MRVDIRVKNQHWLFDSERNTVALFDGQEMHVCTMNEFGGLLKSLERDSN